MKNIAIVVQRYGLEVNGGAEYHARVLAEKLNSTKKYNVTVLTTKSLGYRTWDNHYKNDTELINSIKVKRFDVVEKSRRDFRKYRRVVLSKKLHHKFFKLISIFDFLKNKYGLFTPTNEDGSNFIIAQGPECPNLITYIEQNKDNYNCFIFFTYLYYPTIFGMKIVAEKSIFIPTAHNEPILYTIPFKSIFSVPKFIMYNTLSEKRLVEKNFKNICKNTEIAGMGIDNYLVNIDEVCDTYKYKFDYFVYIGRIEANKGCDELIRFFKRYTKENKKIKLVLVGKKSRKYDNKSSSNILFTGFVNDSEKYYLLKNSKALIIPSKYESLSLVTLESMINEKLVIANKNCEVLKNHIENSEVGYLYNNYQTFKNALNKVLKLSPEKHKSMGKKAKNYVEQNYSWSSVLKKFDTAIALVSKPL